MKKIWLFFFLSLLLIGCDNSFLTKSLMPVLVENNENTLSFEIDSNYAETDNVTSVKVEDTLLDEKGNVARVTEYKIPVSNGFFSFTPKYYGKHNLLITYYDKSGKKSAQCSTNAITKNKHYNIVMMNGTLPVTHVALELVGKLEGQVNIVSLESGAFNWENMPSGTIDCPFATEEQVKTSVISGSNYFSNLVDATDRYIQYLYDLDNESTFSLYITDNYPELILKLLYDNGITEQNSKVYMVTDGTGTYSIYNSVFSNTLSDEEISAKYSEMLKKWNDWKNKAFSKDMTYLDDIEKSVGRSYQMLQDYPSVISNDENVEWWLGRKNTDVLNNEYMWNTYIKTNNTIIARNLNTELSNLTEKEKNTLKNFLHFNDEMFIEAVKQNKKVMLFLGTKKDTLDKYHLESFLTFLKGFYGDEYMYYYKGHPGDPTDLNPERAELLSKLNIADVESSIAAELIYFFNDNIELCGYPSSTYNILPDEAEIPCIMLYDGASNSIFDAQEYKKNINKTICFLEEGKYRICFENSEKKPSNVSYGIWNEKEIPFEVHYYSSENMEIE